MKLLWWRVQFENSRRRRRCTNGRLLEPAFVRKTMPALSELPAKINPGNSGARMVHDTTYGSNSLNNMLFVMAGAKVSRQRPKICRFATHTPNPDSPDASVRRRIDGGTVPVGHDFELENVRFVRVCSHHRSWRRSLLDTVIQPLVAVFRAAKSWSRRGLPSGITKDSHEREPASERISWTRHRT